MNKKGFTLVEIVAVVAIIGLIGVLVVGNLSGNLSIVYITSTLLVPEYIETKSA